MQSYRQTDLFRALVNAACDPRFQVCPEIAQVYNKKRLAQAMRALRSRNIWLYTEGTRTSVNRDNANTIYTQPAGVRLLLLGYADNMRYGAITTATAAGPNPTALALLQMHRVRIVGGKERALIDDFVPAQAGVSGQPRYTSVQLTAPVIIEANEQIAVDLGYDQAGSPEPVNIPPQAFIFFCVKVKDQLTQLDEATVRDIKTFIASNPFQRAMHLNCSGLGRADTGLDVNSAVGDMVTCNTPSVNVPVLVTGIGTTLTASKLTIIDTADGSSFSLNQPIQSSALNMPNYEDFAENATFGAPVVAPIWSSYFPLPVPHLLRRGAQLRANIVNGGDAGAGTNTITEQGLFTQLIFNGITV